MSWNGWAFIYLPGKAVAVPAGSLELVEQGVESTTSIFGYGRRYLDRPDAVPVDPLSLPLIFALKAPLVVVSGCRRQARQMPP